MGAVYHPYVETLQQMLAMAFPDLEIETVEDGVPGATVKHGFKQRMDKQYPSKKKTDESFDWAIVLGGTNDLAYNIKPEEIFNHLKDVYDAPLRRKTKVLALTVPEAGVEKYRERLGARRNELNDLIKGYKRENFHVFDLHSAIPYFAMSQTDRERYWDDPIHFTSDGYDLIGNKVGIALVSILAKERADKAPPPTKKRRLFRDDDKKFEEEVGDPHAIDQGYIVVRRTDLD